MLTPFYRSGCPHQYRSPLIAVVLSKHMQAQTSILTRDSGIVVPSLRFVLCSSFVIKSLKNLLKQLCHHDGSLRRLESRSTAGWAAAAINKDYNSWRLDSGNASAANECSIRHAEKSFGRFAWGAAFPDATAVAILQAQQLWHS